MYRCDTKVDLPFCLPSSTVCICRENRYLLFLTENYAALEILRHYLNDVIQSSPVSSMATVVPANCDGGEKFLEKMEPFILFGSSFPRDKEYTQVCLGSSSLALFHGGYDDDL